MILHCSPGRKMCQTFNCPILLKKVKRNIEKELISTSSGFLATGILIKGFKRIRESQN